MKIRSNRPILVTGINRSGSTWIGKTISHAPHVRYIHEPFNLATAERAYDKTLPRWFHHVTSPDEEYFRDYLKQVLHIPRTHLKEITTAYREQNIRSTVSKITRHYMPRLRGVRPLIKDPIAIFSAVWLAREFDVDVLVIIRHPAAYVWSVIKDPSHMHSLKTVCLEQPELMGHLQPIEQDIHHACDESLPLWHRASIFWKVTYYRICQYQREQPDWLFYRYEDIAHRPIEKFREISHKLALSFTPEMHDYIEIHALNTNRSNQDYDSHIKKYSSKQQYKAWKNNLSPEQIASIRKLTSSVSNIFYSDEDW